MNPPKELIARMLADGDFGVLVSAVCLSAALAVKRTGKSDFVDIQSDHPIPERLQEAVRKAHASCVADFLAAPQEVDRAIALHSAHLKAAGYTYTTGRDN